MIYGTVPELVDQLKRRGVQLRLEQEDIRISAPAGALTDSEKRELRTLKPELLQHLKARLATEALSASAAQGPLTPSLTQESWWRWVRENNHQQSNDRISIVRLVQDSTPQKVEDAVKALIARHEALRTRFFDRGGRLEVALNATQDFRAERTRMEMADALGESAINGHIASCKSRPLPLHGEWLVRAHICEVSPGNLLLVLVLHHLVADGYSVMILNNDLDALLRNDADPQLPPPARGFYDYARQERNWFNGEAGATLVGYWRDWVARQSPLSLRGSREILRWIPGENANNYFTVPDMVAASFKALAQDLKTSSFFVFLTLYAIALSKWTGRDYFPIRCSSNLRISRDLWPTVGTLIGTDAIEIHVEEPQDFASLLRLVEVEYRSATARRLPGLLKFSAHDAHPGCENAEFTQSIAATFNYLPLGKADGAQDRAGGHNTWHVRRAAPDPWRIPLWPIYLRIWDQQGATTGNFQFNEALIARDRQFELMDIFCTEAQKLAAKSAPTRPQGA